MNNKAQIAQWQINWREILRQPIDDIPEDIDSDLELHIGIWQAEVEKRKECFAVFPNGLQMLEQANTIRSIKPRVQAADDSDLIGHLKNINLQVERVLSNSQIQKAIDWNKKKRHCVGNVVYRGNSETGRVIRGKGCSPTEPLDDILPKLFEKKFGELGSALFDFLYEPFYRATHYTDLQMSMFWAGLQDEYEVNPYESVDKLYEINAQARWNENENEMFVFIEE